MDILLDLFKKPTQHGMETFLKSHPLLPKMNLSTPFNFQKTFFRSDGVQRMWLTYNSNSKQLFCFLCLTFSNESNSFTTGMSSWKYVYQRINEHEGSKIHNHCVESYLLFTQKRDINTLLFSVQKDKRKEEVKKNREVFKRIIDSVIFIGKRGLSYRGNKFEAAYSLNNLHDHGNFLELLLFLSNYDSVIKDHLDTVTQKSIKANKAGSKGRGNSLTFISKTTVDYVISAISSLIKKSISEDVNKAQMYSVMLDTTQDIAAKDQCAIVIRYVGNNSVHERLISLINCTDTTGQGMCQLLKDVLKSNDINVKNCVANATDGAANMQGEYNGFNAWLNETAPNQVHVWCYSHVLNLVMSDASKSPLPAAALFTLLNSLAIFFKESYKRMEYFTKRCTSNRRLQSIGETRWWGKEIALNRIFGKINDPSKGMYIEVILALSDVINSDNFKPDIKVKADHMRTSLLKYSTILTAFIYIRIFSITGPLSKYLQTKEMDLLKSQELVDTALEKLIEIQRDMDGVKLSGDVFVQQINSELNQFNLDIVVEEHFPRIRSRKRKILPGEMVEDYIINDQLQKFTVDVHNKILDTIVESMRRRFLKHRDLYTDLSCLSPTNFKEITEQGLSNIALTTLSNKLQQFNKNASNENIKNELKSFAENWNKLKKSIPETYATIYMKNNNEEEDEEVLVDTQTNDNDSTTLCKSCKNCFLCCYTVLTKYNLYCQTYSNLYLAYKYVLTLPSTQVTCERSFSQLKNIKTRLRSQLTDSKLEAFMMMGVEKEKLASLDHDEIIKVVSQQSDLLYKS